MNNPTPRAASAALETLVRQVPGVTAIYRPSRTLGQTLSAMKRPLSHEAGDEPLVHVTDTDGRLHVTVTIGTRTEPATSTCRTVYDTISDWLREHDLHEGRVEVTVAQVNNEKTR